MALNTAAVNFGLDHTCMDGQAGNGFLYWRDEHGGMTEPQEWLTCVRCHAAVRIQTRWPSGKVATIRYQSDDFPARPIFTAHWDEL